MINEEENYFRLKESIRTKENQLSDIDQAKTWKKDWTE